MSYQLGLTSLDQETPLVKATVEGELPLWLEGSLFRNGPACWDIGGQRLGHWFDGFAMLHLFAIAGGEVHYRNRFLEVPYRSQSLAKGKLAHAGFASDPCRSLFKKVQSLFVSEIGGNANINLLRIGERFIAMTETPMAVEFDSETLETRGFYDYGRDGVSGQLTSAHPIPAEDGVYNFTVSMGPTSRYCAYRIPPGQDGRQVVSTYPVSEPGYLHSCGLSPQHLILVEGPLVVNPLHLLWRDKPYIDCYRWEPERGTGVILLDRNNGKSRRVEGPPMFVFHHVNAFEDGRDICVDVLAYDDPEIIKALYLTELDRGAAVPMPLLKRLRIGVGETFTVQTLSPVPLELPRIASHDQGQDYRDVWGVTRVEGSFYDGLARVDARGGEPAIWSSPGCYPGEPVPVDGPSGEKVVLSAVLDSGRAQSFLLCLDADTMKERARAYVPAVVPFGFHGGFYRA